MKRFSILSLFLLLVVLAATLPSCNSTKANSETEFWIRGNCDMCKKTIETALNDVNGVSAADYKLEANSAHVSFDSTLTNVDALHKAVADAGYETKSVLADPGAYNDLPMCCKKKTDQ